MDKKLPSSNNYSANILRPVPVYACGQTRVTPASNAKTDDISSYWSPIEPAEITGGVRRLEDHSESSGSSVSEPIILTQRSAIGGSEFTRWPFQDLFDHVSATSSSYADLRLDSFSSLNWKSEVLQDHNYSRFSSPDHGSNLRRWHCQQLPETRLDSAFSSNLRLEVLHPTDHNYSRVSSPDHGSNLRRWRCQQLPSTRLDSAFSSHLRLEVLHPKNPNYSTVSSPDLGPNLRKWRCQHLPPTKLDSASSNLKLEVLHPTDHNYSIVSSPDQAVNLRRWNCQQVLENRSGDVTSYSAQNIPPIVTSYVDISSLSASEESILISRSTNNCKHKLYHDAQTAGHLQPCGNQPRKGRWILQDSFNNNYSATGQTFVADKLTRWPFQRLFNNELSDADRADYDVVKASLDVSNLILDQTLKSDATIPKLRRYSGQTNLAEIGLNEAGNTVSLPNLETLQLLGVEETEHEIPFSFKDDLIESSTDPDSPVKRPRALRKKTAKDNQSKRRLDIF